MRKQFGEVSRDVDPRIRHTWFWIPVLIRYVSLHFYTWAPHLLNADAKNSYCKALLWQVNVIILFQCLAYCLEHRSHLLLLSSLLMFKENEIYWSKCNFDEYEKMIQCNFFKLHILPGTLTLPCFSLALTHILSCYTKNLWTIVLRLNHILKITLLWYYCINLGPIHNFLVFPKFTPLHGIYGWKFS